MRLIGTLPNEQLAQRFADHLLPQRINIMVEEGATGWSIWVEDDDHVDQAKGVLAQYTANPDDPRYNAAESVAARLRARDEDRQKRLERNYIDVRTQLARPAVGRRPVTFALIAVCCVVAAASFSTEHSREANAKFFMAIRPLLITATPAIPGQPQLPEIRHGQVWRLVTPVLIHFDIWHLLFNMLFLYQLGSLIEIRKGSWTLLGLVLISAVPSNFLQYLWPIDSFAAIGRFWLLQPNPYGGGMSGVIYALFGYVWLKGRLQPYEGMIADQNTILVMLVWLVLCFSGMVGPIGNTAHGVGLIVGAALGAGPYLWRRIRR